MPVIVSGKSETTKFLCLVQLDIISKWPKRLLNGSKNEQTTNKDQKKKTRCNLFLDWVSLKLSLFTAIQKKYKVQILPNPNRDLWAACVHVYFFYYFFFIGLCTRLIAIIVKRSQ